MRPYLRSLSASALLLVMSACGGGGGGGTTPTPPQTPALAQQTISFAQAGPITRTMSDGAFSNAASGGSGTGAIAYSSSQPTVATVNGSTGAVSLIAPGTTTITAIKAADATYAAAQSSYQLNVMADTMAPDTLITSAPPAFTELNAAAFSFTSTETNSTFEVSIDGSAFAPATSPHSLTSVGNGAHTFAVRARDSAGNIDGSPATHAWTVAPLPNTSIATSPAALTSSTTASFTFASDAAGATFSYSLDGAAFIDSGATAQLTGVSDGVHELRVRAVIGGMLLDPTPATATWTVDATLPTASITFPTPRSYTDANTITVRGSASDAHGIASLKVNGVTAQTATSFATWTANVPVNAGDTSLIVSVTDSLGNVNSNADTATITNNGPPFANLRAMDIDTAHNRILGADEALMALVAIDLSTGATSILSDLKHGTGPAFEGIEGVVLDGTRALVLDWALNDIIAVDLATGNRTSLSAVVSDEETDFGIGGIAVDSANHVAYVVNADTQSVIAINLDTGERSVVSSISVGAGTFIGRPLDVVLDTSTNPDRLLVIDESRLMAITISNGDRAVLSSSPPTGSGVALEFAIRMRMDVAHNRVLISQGVNRQAVTAVDLTTGNRTTIADANSGTGRSLSFPMAIAVNAAGSRAYVTGNLGTELLAIDLQTLNRTLHSSTNIGTGQKSMEMRGLQVEGSSLLFLDGHGHSLHRFDLNSSERTLISGPDAGSGPAFYSPQHFVYDAAANRTYVVDNVPGSVLSVDMTTGDRTVLSSILIGSGEYLLSPVSIALDSVENRALVMETSVELVGVDLSSGNQTILTGRYPRNSGPTISGASQVVLDRMTNPQVPRALVAHSNAPGIISVNLLTGDRALLSTAPPFGSGLAFRAPGGIWLDSSGQRLLALDWLHRNLMSVSLANGNRQIVSGGSYGQTSVIATGPEFAYPWALSVDPATGIAYVADTYLHAIFAVDVATGQRIIISR